MSRRDHVYNEDFDDAFCRRCSILFCSFRFRRPTNVILWIKSFFPDAEILDSDVIIPDSGQFVFLDKPTSETALTVKGVAEAVKKYELFRRKHH